MPGLYTVHGLSVSHKTAYLKSLCIVITNKVLSVSGSSVVKSSCYCRVLWSLSTMFYCFGETSALVVIYLILVNKLWVNILCYMVLAILYQAAFQGELIMDSIVYLHPVLSYHFITKLSLHMTKKLLN